MHGYLAEVEQKIASNDWLIINLGLLDTPERSLAAAHEARRCEVDILLVYVSTYALSATILPLIRGAHVPVVLLNLQPASAIDYDRLNQMDRVC